MLAEHFHWSYQQVMDAPEWWLERAELWIDELAKHRKSEHDRLMRSVGK